MAKLDLYFPTLIKNEGDFVNHPKDPGGATKYGIILTNWIKWGRDLDNDGDIDVEDLKRISEKDAYTIYKTHFWDVINGDAFKNQNVANIVFDMYVNAPGVAIRMLQRLLNLFFKNNLEIDGKVGPLTIQAINAANAATLHDAYKSLRETYYRYRAGQVDNSNPWHKWFASLGFKASTEWDVFLKGWLNRVNSFVNMLQKKSSLGSLLVYPEQ